MTINEFNLWFDPIFDQVRDTNLKWVQLDDGFCGNTNDTNFPSQYVQNQISDKTISNFYSFVSEWRRKWSTKKDFENTAQGTFNILPLDKVMQDSWDETLGGNDWAPGMKGFRPLDMFYDMDGFVEIGRASCRERVWISV